ncbi:MAG: chemotaxis protein CheW [Dehalococcoidia bacterium]|nr:chemotaxis protein CheW [Dehalococcoidia bacterium]
MLDVAQAETGARPALELITFRVADQDFCVEAVDVKEIRGWTSATPTPDSPDYVRGVINLRGAVLPIVDLAARLNLPSPEPSSRHVFIVVWIKRRLVGLLVDAVCDIVSAPAEAVQPTPSLQSGALETLVAALVTVGDRMVALLALDDILPVREAAP